jgi:hypothetical protein
VPFLPAEFETSPTCGKQNLHDAFLTWNNRQISNSGIFGMSTISDSVGSTESTLSNISTSILYFRILCTRRFQNHIFLPDSCLTLPVALGFDASRKTISVTFSYGAKRLTCNQLSFFFFWQKRNEFIVERKVTNTPKQLKERPEARRRGSYPPPETPDGLRARCVGEDSEGHPASTLTELGRRRTR